ncbi:unnamed protein product [Closterium sp. NIES-53]
MRCSDAGAQSSLSFIPVACPLCPSTSACLHQGEWDAVVRTYERDSVFLGEAAQILVHNTNYDIPYWQKHRARAQQQLEESNRKELDCRRLAAAAAKGFQQACSDLGIKGLDGSP